MNLGDADATNDLVEPGCLVDRVCFVALLASGKVQSGHIDP